MSSRKLAKSGKRTELLREVQDLGRKISSQTVFLHQAIAQDVGLNATDTRCVDLIASDGGMVTAGRISDLTGLTTGAITHILDRLERRGIVERVRDSEDRRRVLVRVRAESLEPLLPKYDALAKAFLAVAGEYSDDELALICGYMRKMSETTERLMAEMMASAGARR
ncbi:MAG TPA: helix-turn-helix domain-containing protein [Bryobacteraceae bacterium]|nr:helix-turn-helix domain-containing protein [Bryobacteraceae bacterium]